MKVAIYSESEADEKAIRVLTDAIVGHETEPSPLPWLRARGWDALLSTLPKVVLYLHYQTDADALIVVGDSDRTVVHNSQHSNATDAQCRHCALEKQIEYTLPSLRPRAVGNAIRVMIAVAVPTIEAWYRCGLDNGVSEAAWVNGLATNQLPYDARRLKRDAYGTDRPSLQLEIEKAVENAQRLAADTSQLERCFPNGFGLLAKQLRDLLA